MASELARVFIDFVNDMVEAVCVRLGPMVGARPKEVKIGLGVALGLIALHRLMTAPGKRGEPSAAGVHDAGLGDGRLARPGAASGRGREVGVAEAAAAAVRSVRFTQRSFVNCPVSSADALWPRHFRLLWGRGLTR